MPGTALRAIKTAAFLAAVAFCQSGTAQSRLSLAERVQRLESQAQGSSQSGQTTVELLNRLNELQTEIQSLRGLVEQQNFEIENLKKAQRDRYLDLDSRLSRLEGHAPAPPGGLNTAPTEPPQPGQLMLDEPAGAQPGVGSAPPDVADDTVAAEPGIEPGAGANSAQDVPATPAAAPMDAKQAYDDAFAALRDGRYAESARRFAAFLEKHPSGEYADNARYWLGESYYVTQNYRIALDTFNELLAKHPQSAKAPDALLKVGYCYYELREWNKAEATLNEVIARYPDTTVARLAQGRLRALRLEGQHG